MQTLVVMSYCIVFFWRRFYSVSEANYSFKAINNKVGRNLRSSGILRIAEWNSFPTFRDNLLDPCRWERPRRKHVSFIRRRKPEITNNMSYWTRIASHFKLGHFFQIYVLKTRAWISLTSPASVTLSYLNRNIFISAFVLIMCHVLTVLSAKVIKIISVSG